MNKKGFTMIELLVSISILAIITVLALPGITRLLSNSGNQKFTSYEQAMKNSAELFVDSYKDDLWGRNETGCITVSYADLVVNELLKAINVDKTTCDDPDTFVMVNKNGNKYEYETSLVCKKDNKVVYSNKTDASSCKNATDLQPPVISTSPNGLGSKSKWYNKNNTNRVTVTIEDVSNLMANASFKYKWTTNKDDTSEDGYQTVTISNYKTNTVKSTSTKINIPTDISGIYYLKIIPIAISDFAGNVQSNTYTSNPFYLDNTNPTCTITSNNTGVTPSLTITANGSDAHSGIATDGYSWTSATSGFAAQNTKYITDNGTYVVYVKDSTGNVGSCDTTITNIYKKPNKPTITNPTNGNWVNYSYSLTVKTTTEASRLGYWYYSFDNKTFTRYDASLGLSTYTTTQFTAERNQNVYIRVCNNGATGPTDTPNCSDSASTRIKIDKTPPNSPKMISLTVTNGRANANNCMNNGGGQYHVNCTAYLYPPRKKLEYFDTLVYSDNLSGVNRKQYIWNHNGGGVKCLNWVNNCEPFSATGSGPKATYIWTSLRAVDNAGNAGYATNITYVITWP